MNYKTVLQYLSCNICIYFYYKTVILFQKQTCYNLSNERNYILIFSVYTKIEKGVFYERSIKNREFKEILWGKY